MTPTNVDFVRSIFAPWERGDYGSVTWAHPEIGYVIFDGPTPGSWTGVAAMAEGWRDVLSYFDAESARADLGLAAEAEAPRA